MRKSQKRDTCTPCRFAHTPVMPCGKTTRNPGETGSRPADSTCSVTNVIDVKPNLDRPTGLWLLLLRAAAFVGSVAIGATFHWYFHLVHTRPGDYAPLIGHTVRMVEHGKDVYVTTSDQLALYLLALSIAVFFVPTMWLETRNMMRRNDLPSPYFADLHHKGIETHLGKVRKSPHNIFTLPARIALGASVLLAGLSIGWNLSLFSLLGL